MGCHNVMDTLSDVPCAFSNIPKALRVAMTQVNKAFMDVTNAFPDVTDAFPDAAAGDHLDLFIRQLTSNTIGHFTLPVPVGFSYLSSADR
jgi:hypothetical protein